MEKYVDLVLSTPYGKVFVCCCLRVEYEVTAFCVVTEETAELVEIADIFTALACLVYYARIVVGKLICETINLVKKHYTALRYPLLQEQMLFT